MNTKNIARYFHAGLPATGYVQINAVPAAGKTVVVAGTTYTYGTNFGGSDPVTLAKAITALVNGDQVDGGLPTPNTQPISTVYAAWYGLPSGKAVVRFIATQPGAAGNAITLSTNDSTSFSVSGATFSGGADPVSTPRAATSSSVIRTTLVTVAANANRASGFITNLSTGILYVKEGTGCSASDFSGILTAGSAADDGYGGTYPLTGYTGVVTVFSAGSYRYVVVERS